jgi:Ca2+-binding EF-hand superfamily protein
VEAAGRWFVGDFGMSVARSIGIAGLALLAAACSGGPGRRGPPPGFGDEDGPPRPRAQLFISPSGQPFRAPPDQPYPSAAWFAAADADHDGKLTRAEFRADADAWFKVLDADGDGVIGMPEVTRWEEELVPEIARMAMGGGGMGMRGGVGGPRGRNELNTRSQGAAAFSLINEPHPIRGADTDVDYKVTRAEWRAAADRRFAILDPDGDGVVLAADLKRTPVQFAQDGPRSTLRREAVGQRRR